MKKYLLTMLLIPTLLFADAVIFSGSDVKTLKGNIDLFGKAKILTTSTIPTSGLTAPIGSIALYLTNGTLYMKTGALSTDWTKNQTGPVNLTSDVTGVLPIANGGTGSATQNFVDLTTAQSIAGLKNFTDALTITSNSANSLAVGPNGTTNPVFQVDSSTASAATGVKVTGAAAGTAPIIAAISSGTNEDIALASKGTGSVKLQVNSLNKYIASQYAHTFTSTAYLGANTVRFGVTGSSDTTLTASVEAPNAYFNFGQTRQHATGALTLQRDFRITPSTHSFVGASNLTNAAAFSIDGPSNGGTNATLASSSALYIPTSALTNVTNSYGLNVAASTGATNNYAAYFQTGNIGIGIAAPAAPLHISRTTTTGTITSVGTAVTGTGTNFTSTLAVGDTIIAGSQGRIVTAITDNLNLTVNTAFTSDFAVATAYDRLGTALNAGSVGIGTVSPIAKLHINAASGTSETVGLALHSALSSTSGLPAYGLGMGPTGSEGYLTYRSGTAASSVFGHKWFVNDVEIMRARGDGRVGIGLTAPTYPLDVQGVIQAKGTSSIILDSSTGIIYTATGLGNSTTLNNGKIQTLLNGPFIERNVADANPSLIVSNLHASSTGDIAQFKSAGTVKAALSSAGNFGVGTASPGALIHAATTNSTAYTPTSAALAIPANILTTIENLDTTDSTAALLSFVSRSGGAVNRAFIGNVSNTAGGSIVFGHRTGTTAYAERMRIDYLGNLGIGTSSPNANAILDVTSTTKASMPFPRMTTAQKLAVSSPTAGMVVYDTDMKGISYYNGAAWVTTNNKSVSTKTANYTGLYSDDVILGDATSGAITITLPTAVGFSGKVFNIKKTDSSVNSVTIATTSSQTIDGALTAPLISQYQSLTLVSNGTNWSVL